MISQSNTRTKILSSALVTFNKSGFDATPTSRIAKEAGVSNGTLFHYFPKKEILINEIYLDVKKKLRQAMVKGLEENASTKEKLQRLWTNFIGWGLKFPDEYLFMKQFRNSPSIDHETREAASQIFVFLGDIVKHGIEEGSIVNEDFDFIMSYITYGPILTLEYLLHNERENLQDLIEKSFEMHWRALKK